MLAMLNYPAINPVAFSLGPFAVHWYGIMYLMGFGTAWLLGVYRAKKSCTQWTRDQVSDVIVYASLGVILGGRVGYMLFYEFPIFLHKPWTIFYVWDGGMSFHGGLLGVLLALWLFAQHYQKNLWDITDFIAPLVPLGLMFGRIGNFINDELWGRMTQMPWGLVFPNAGPYPRHPSQLYEAGLEGIVMFFILWIFSAKSRPRFAVSALFLVLYGVFRCFVEFFRVPDPQYGYIAFNWLTVGQVYSLPMIALGGFCLWYVYHKQGNKNVRTKRNDT